MSAARTRATLREGSYVLICREPAVVVEVSATGIKLQNSDEAIAKFAWMDLVRAGRVRG